MEAAEKGQLPSARARRKIGLSMEIDEVNEFVSLLAKGYKEQFSSVNVYPFDDDLEPVDPLTLKPRLLSSKKVKRRVSQVVKVVPALEKEEVLLGEQLRSPDGDHPPFVSVVGASGSGKSTVLQQIALAWASMQDGGQEGAAAAADSLRAVPPHLQWVRDYQFVLLLDVEVASVSGDDGSISDLVRSQLISVDGLVRVGRVWRHLQDSQNKVLVLLDNLHAANSLRGSKLSQLLQRHNNALPHSVLITTQSEDWTFPLPVDLITCRLQIAEQSAEEQRSLVATMLNTDVDALEVEACMTKIDGNPFIREFATTPFTTMMACHTWRRLGDVPPTASLLVQYAFQMQIARVYYRGFQEVECNDDIPTPVAEGLRKLGQLAVTCLEMQRLTCDSVAVETWCSWPQEVLMLGLLRKQPISLQRNSGYVYTFVNKILADYVAAMWLSFDPFLRKDERPLLDDPTQFSRVASSADADHDHLTFSHCADSDISQFNMVYRMACSLMHESKAVRLITALNHKMDQSDSEVDRMDFTVLVLHCLYECNASSDLCDLASQILHNPILLHACESSLGMSGADLHALAYYQQTCNARAESLAVEAGPSADDSSVHKFLGARGLKCVKFSWHNWLHRNNKVSARQCTAIGAALKATSCTIVQLQIALTSLSDNVVQDIAFGLKVNQSVRHLTLCNLAPYLVPEDLLSDDGAKRLAAALDLNNTLTSLSLPGSALSTAGIRALAKRLESPYCALEVLDLSPVRYVDDEAAKHLAESLRNNHTLKTLRISKAVTQAQTAVTDPDKATMRSIGNKGAQHLAEMLQSNTCLETLDIQNHSIGDQGAVFLADGLMRNSTLTTLLLGWSQIGSQGYECLQQAWDMSTTLRTLDLPYYEQEDEEEFEERRQSTVTIRED